MTVLDCGNSKSDKGQKRLPAVIKYRVRLAPKNGSQDGERPVAVHNQTFSGPPWKASFWL